MSNQHSQENPRFRLKIAHKSFQLLQKVSLPKDLNEFVIEELSDEYSHTRHFKGTAEHWISLGGSANWVLRNPQTKTAVTSFPIDINYLPTYVTALYTELGLNDWSNELPDWLIYCLGNDVSVHFASSSYVVEYEVEVKTLEILDVVEKLYVHKNQFFHCNPVNSWYETNL